MDSLKSLFNKRQLGFTAYNPDCTQSRLWGDLDHTIHQATGFHVVHRQWFNHDINSLFRFYSDGQENPPEQDPEEAARKYEKVPPEELQPGHLFGKLMLSGPVLLTFWQGDNAVETLLRLKGKTHPAEAASDTIRGGFWCDNAICNLMHVSDNADEMARELAAIRLTDLLEQAAQPLNLLEPVAIPNQIAHSGLVMVWHLLNRNLMTMNQPSIPLELPESGDAHETNQTLTALLQQTAADLPETAITRFITAYLDGDLVTVSHMMKQLPVTPWEHFVIQCGACTRDGWNKQQ